MPQVVEIPGDTATEVLIATPVIQEVVTPALETQVITAGAVVIAGTKTLQIGHTFAVSGNITVVTLPAFFIDLAVGQLASVVSAIYKISTGTNVTFKLQRNGADMAGYGTTGTPLTATTTKATSSGIVAVGDTDQIDLVILSTLGGPQNLSITLTLQHTI